MAVATARQVSCASNQRQIGMWGMLYTDDWNGILPHNGGNWVGAFSGYSKLSSSSWVSKNPDMRKQKSGTILHCPQALASAQPCSAPSWNYIVYSNTYGLNRYMGGVAVADIPIPRRNLLSGRRFWFADGGGLYQPDGTFAYFYMVELNSWSGYGGNYSIFPFYHTGVEFHPRQSCNFLYGDGRVAPMAYEKYFSMSVSEKEELQGHSWW